MLPEGLGCGVSRGADAILTLELRLAMPNTASGFLAEATLGLKYVRSKIDFGSSNKFTDNLRTLGVTALAVPEVYKLEERYLKAMNVPIPIEGSANWQQYGLQYIESMAGSAELMGTGNCEELAAMAFMFFRNRRVLPVDYVMIPGKHAFCVIGARVRLGTGNFSEWSTGISMACDPWSGRAEPADMIAIRYPAYLRKMFSAYRVPAEP